MADEVRKLAEESTRQATEVSSIIAQITGHVVSAEKAVAEGNKNVDTGVLKVRYANTTFSKIIEFVNQSVSDITEIRTANLSTTVSSQALLSLTQEVKVNVTRPVQEVKQVYSSTKEIAAATENLAVGAGQINQVAGNLQSLVSKFSL